MSFTVVILNGGDFIASTALSSFHILLNNIFIIIFSVFEKQRKQNRLARNKLFGFNLAMQRLQVLKSELQHGSSSSNNT